MNRHLRSKLVAAGIASALLAAGTLYTIPLALAGIQGPPAAAQGADPVGASAARQARILQYAQDAVRDGHLAHAVRLYQWLLADPQVKGRLRRQANDGLVLAQARQNKLIPSMKALLHKAIAAYRAGRLDEAQNDLYRIRMTGSNLGPENALPAHYARLIAARRAAAVQAIEQAQAANAAAARAAAQKQAQLAAQRKAAAAKAKLAAARQAQVAKLAAARAAAQKAQAEKLAAAQAAARKVPAPKPTAAQRAAQAAAQRRAAEKLAQQRTAQALLAQLHAQQEQAETQRQSQNTQLTALAQAQAAKLAARQKAAARKLVREKLAARRKAAAAKAKLAAEQAAARQAQAAKLAAAGAAAQKAQAEKLAAARAAAEKAQAEKVAALRAAAAHRFAAQQLARRQQQLEAQLLGQLQVQQEQAETQRQTQAAQAAAAQQAAAMKLAAEQAAARKAQAARLAARQAAAQKAQAQKIAAAMKLAAEQAKAQKAQAEKIAAAQKLHAAQAAAARQAAARRQQTQAQLLQQLQAQQEQAASRQQTAATRQAAAQARAAAAARLAAQKSAAAAQARQAALAAQARAQAETLAARQKAAALELAARQAAAQRAARAQLAATINAQRAAALVVQADQAVHAGRYHRAITLYADALSLNPRNQAAAMGLTYARKLAAGQAPGLLSQSLYNQAIVQQRTQVQYNQFLRASSDALRQGQLLNALDDANDALAAITAAKHMFPRRQYEFMKVRAQRQIALVRQQHRVAVARTAALHQQAIQQNQAQMEWKFKLQRRRQVNQLMGQANQYLRRLQYTQALGALNQVVAIDPTNNSARLMQQMVRDQIEYRKWSHYHNERYRQQQKQVIASEKAMIPYRKLLVYPSDWPQLSRMRRAEKSRSQSPADIQLHRRLAQTLPSIVVHGLSFSDVIRLLRRETNANIVVDWTALAAAGITPQAPISLTLHGVSLRTLLHLVLQQAQGSSGARLGYDISGGVLTISTTANLAQHMVTRIYNVQDLTIYRQPPMQSMGGMGGGMMGGGMMGGGMMGGGGIGGIGGGGIGGGGIGGIGGGGIGGGIGGGGIGGGGGMMGGGMMGGGYGGVGGGMQNMNAQNKKIITKLEKRIEKSVHRKSWRHYGGTGTIHSFDGLLFVTQTPNIQDKVHRLLTEFREAYAVEISISARFLVVNTGFLNDFGFSWSLNFPSTVTSTSVPSTSSSSGAATTTTVPTGANSAMFGNSIGPLAIGNNTASLTTPTATGVGANVANNFSQSALSLGGSILSNYQLSLLLQATQLSKNSTTLTAPRITLISGETATFDVFGEQAYVAEEIGGQTASGLGGIVTTAPTLVPSYLMTGVFLTVSAAVTPGHRYVIMNLSPSLISEQNLQTFNVTGQQLNGASTPTTAGFIQLPSIQTTMATTTVTVPDGGTLLIGGQRLAGETEVEAGVPVLSKIPFINRLFTNRSYVRDTGILLMLIRPTIIIHKEWEKKQFGRNY